MAAHSTKNHSPASFQRVWHLKLNDPGSQRALWLRWSILSSRNGFKRVAEVWAVFFQRGPNREIKKTALKQTFDIRAFSETKGGTIQIGNCILSPHSTQGSIQSKGNSIEWDLKITSVRNTPFSLIPEAVAKAGLAQNTVVTDHEELFCNGSTRVNGETATWNEAPGMQGRLAGKRSGYSWVWGHCNTFLNQYGKPAPLVFEGFTARIKLGPLTSPNLSSFYFRYNDENYFFNTVRDALFLKSHYSVNQWKFQADRGDLSFRGVATAEHKDFAGLTYEDTTGSLLYCSNASLSDMQILVYKKGKLESTLSAQGTASFEVVSREKNPYVPILV